MNDSLPLDVFSRWIHVGSAIVILGGTFFLRVVVIPAAAGLSDGEHSAFRGRLMATWRKFVYIGITLFLLSGFYNYITVSVPRHRGDGLYHGLMGVKMLLAFVIFFLASALAGRSKAFEGMRLANRRWLAIILVLGFLIVGISGYLKVGRPGSVAEAASAPVEPESSPGRT
jgi:uncharacterized membrane protein